MREHRNRYDDSLDELLRRELGEPPLYVRAAVWMSWVSCAGVWGVIVWLALRC